MRSIDFMSAEARSEVDTAAVDPGPARSCPDRNDGLGTARINGLVRSTETHGFNDIRMRSMVLELGGKDPHWTAVQ